MKVLYHIISYPLSQTLGKKDIHQIKKKNVYDKFKSSRGLIILLRVPANGKCETQEDVWSVWDGIHGITRRPENIKVYPTCNLLVVVAMSEDNNLTSKKPQTKVGEIVQRKDGSSQVFPTSLAWLRPVSSAKEDAVVQQRATAKHRESVCAARVGGEAKTSCLVFGEYFRNLLLQRKCFSPPLNVVAD